MAFDSPNFTQVPNIFIESFMRDLSPAEVKVMLVILRYTTGFHRRQAPIALSTFINLTGLSRQGVINSTDSVEEKGWVAITRGNVSKKSEYEIIIKNDTGQLSRPPKEEVVNSVDQGSQLSRPELVNSVDHIKKEKENKRKDNVTTPPPSSKDKGTQHPDRFVNKLTSDQRKLHDQIVRYKPQCGESPDSNSVCAWFLDKKTHGYTNEQIANAFLVYRQDEGEMAQKGQNIASMAAYMLGAIKSNRTPRNAAYEANKQSAKFACQGVKDMRILDRYVSYMLGKDEITINYNLPMHTFMGCLEDAKRKIQNQMEYA